MDKNKQFLEHRTKEITHILFLISEKSNLLDEMMNQFDLVVRDCYKYSNSDRTLETIRTVLCAFYQEKHPCSREKCDEHFKSNLCQKFATAFKKIVFSDIHKVLYNQQKMMRKSFRYWPQVSLVLDILTLHMVFYSEEVTILRNIRNLQNQIHQHLVSNDKNIWHIDIKMTNFYLDSLYLFRKRYGSNDRSYDDKISVLFMKNIEAWLPNPKNGYEYELLTLILPKVVKLITGRGILPKIWQLIFALETRSSVKLHLLWVTVDVWFPMGTEDDTELIHQTLEEPFWLLLLECLSGSFGSQCLQASELYKRVVDFDTRHKSQDSKSENYQESGSLVDAENDSMRESFKKSISNLFSILDALDEGEEDDLDTQVFPLIKNILDETFNRDNSNTRFHAAWVHCAFSRLLEYRNVPVVKWVMLNVFTLDPELYDNDFLDTVLNALDATCLYENDVKQEEPVVLEELIRFLNFTKTKKSDLITRFMVQASAIPWYSVPQVYIIHAISVVKKNDSTWNDLELEAIKALGKTSSILDCRILRIGSQIELLETMTYFTTESLDLMAIAKTLAEFSTSEVLIRGQSAWNRIATWLSKIVKQEEALGFVEKTCQQLTNQNSEKEFSVKLFSLMIMLFHDAHLVLNSKLCPGLTMLHNLLQCLIQPESKPLADAELKNKSIEFICNLLEFTSPKDCILREFISDYAEASLRFTFKNLRKICDEALVDNIDTYVSVTQKLFTAESSIITKREVLNYIERFEIESWNIIEDGEYSNNVQRFFGIKILYVCLKARSMHLKNYKFIKSLHRAYKSPMTQPCKTIKEEIKTKEEIETNDESKDLGSKIVFEYYKIVAELFYEYLKDEPADEWILSIDWIKEVTYLAQVGGEGIFVPLVGVLSQIFHKNAIPVTEMDNFKSATRLCWKSITESNKYELALQEMMNLIYSISFLESQETRELTIEFTNEMLGRIKKISGLSIILLKGLEQVQGEYLSNFYEAIIVCSLHGTALDSEEIIELQARTYVLDSYQEIYPKYLSDLNVNDDAATRAHAVILLHKMISDDPTHAVKLLELIVTKLNVSHNELGPGGSTMHYIKNRIMQVLLILQPMLKKDDIGSLYTLMCNNILSGNSQPSVRIMEEWLLIRIYLESETFRGRIWDLFDEGQEKCLGGSSSVLQVVYHVARSLSSDLQPEFMNLVFQYIMPYCMAQQYDVRINAQVIASKLYDLATEMSYSTVTEKYRELYIALTKNLKYENEEKNSSQLLNDFYFAVFNPIDDYSLQTVFYELPKLSNVPMDEFIPLQTFEKFGFKESNNHPLRLLDLRNDLNGAQASEHVFKFPGSAEPETSDFDNDIDCNNDIENSFTTSEEEIKPNVDVLSEVSRTSPSLRNIIKDENDIILVTSLLDKLPNLRVLGRVCRKLGVKEFVMSSIDHPEERQFQTFSASVEKLFTFVEVRPQELHGYLTEKKNMGYRLVGTGQTSNSANLLDVKLKGKTVLLLGNEKAGILADLIPLLHECMEIP